MAGTERFLIAGVMGHPIMHSRSPMLHNHWIEAHGIAGRYLPLAVRPEGLAPALAALPALGFRGCNLTMPHKESAVPLMAEVSPLVRRIGAMNCVVVEEDGRLVGHNFEAFGYAESLAQEIPGWRPDAGPIAVIGAGGAARAVVAGLAERGAREIRVFNRSPERAERLVEALGPPAVAMPWARRNEALADAILLVNATSQGMHGSPPLDVRLDALEPDAAVSDLVYAPRETPLLAEARRRGHVGVNGIGMLINQARPAFEAWFGVLPEATPALRARIEATI